jgi:DNA replication and repair protein RecF
VLVRRIDLTDFRIYRHADITFSPGVTAILGANAQGKTSLAEAMAWLATAESFRGAADDALVRDGADSAYVRAWVTHDDGREILVEAEINRTGRNRVQINKQRLARVRDLLGVMRTTVFSPGDLDIVHEGPAVRRKLLDDALVALNPADDGLRRDYERILRQRNTLLRQCMGRLGGSAATTLDVWDEQLVAVGSRIGDLRAELVADLVGHVRRSYADLAAAEAPLEVIYDPPWRSSGLEAAVAEARNEDVRRSVTTVGPHRDDVVLMLKSMPARTHASQGECRTLALALRLAVHRLVTERVGSAPLLVLDDVLSELDPTRAAALLANMPSGQVIITSASPLPPEARPDTVMRVSAGAVVSEEPT